MDGGIRPMRETADPLTNIYTVNLYQNNCKSCFSDELQTLISKMMSYLLKHGRREQRLLWQPKAMSK